MVARLVLVLWVVGCMVAGGVLLVDAAPVKQGDPVELVYGQTVDGQIDIATPSVFYVFEAAAGDVVTITMIVTGGELDPFLILSDAAQTPLTTDDNSSGGVNARLAFTIPTAGRYLIRATHSGGVPPEEGGAFSLNLTAAVGDVTPLANADQTATDLPPQVQGDTTRLLPVTPGATVRDSLDRQVALRFYWFEAAAGDQVTVIPEQLADFQPLFVLYDGSFTELQRAEPGAGLRTRLAQGGVFFLVVALPDTGSAGGGYGFVYDLSGNPARQGNAIDIVYGQSQRGTIDAAIPAINYRFRGTAGDNVTILMTRAGGDLNSYLFLLDKNGQLLYEDNDGGGDNGDARIVCTLPSDGEYLIVATRLGQAQGTTSGSFLLDLQSDALPPPGQTPEAALEVPAEYIDLPELTYGETVEGSLSDVRFMDFYVFSGSQGDPVTVEMVSQNGTEPNGLDPLLILLDDARIPLIENDDIVDGVQRDSRIEFTLPRTGYYAIVATRFDQADGTTAGPYTLTLDGPGAGESSEPVSTTSTLIRQLSPVLLEPGAPAQETFGNVPDLYAFTASAGTLIDLAVTTDPGLDSVLILADASLNEILSSGTGAITGITATETGQYVVIIASRFGPANVTPGGYILALTQGGTEDNPVVEVPSGPLALVYGDVATGTINDDLTSQIYTFTGRAGDNVRITLEAAPGSELDCYLELQDANGGVVAANDDIDPGVIRNSEITAELPADGEYVVIASRYVGPDADITSGGFRLSLKVLDEQALAASGVSDEVVLMAYGDTEVGEINDTRFLLFYVFNGTAGDVVTVEVSGLTGNLDSVLHLYQSSGAGWIEIASNDDSPRGGTYDARLENVILPVTGKYLIAISRYGLERENTFGTFSLTLTKAP